MDYCKECGARLPHDKEFCEECGARVPFEKGREPVSFLNEQRRPQAGCFIKRDPDALELQCADCGIHRPFDPDGDLDGVECYSCGRRFTDSDMLEDLKALANGIGSRTVQFRRDSIFFFSLFRNMVASVISLGYSITD